MRPRTENPVQYERLLSWDPKDEQDEGWEEERPQQAENGMCKAPATGNLEGGWRGCPE